MAGIPAALADALRSRYLLERELGRGGMATVYLARDLKHDRSVALKVLHTDLAAALGSERFLLEIRQVARLQHPHILPVHDSGESAGRLWFTMPYVEGESLRARLLHGGELPIGEAVRLLRDVVDALAYAHRHGLVHRDIKPDNVLISGQHAIVADFGVAKALSIAGDRSSQTSAGLSLGTPGYMPPEQAAGDPHVDHRADIYAVGVLAYEMLTGELPFTGPTAQAILTAQLTQRPLPLSAVRPNVSAALEDLVARCLEKRPADRPQSADELVQELEGIRTPAGSGPIQLRRGSTYRSRIIGIAALVLVGLATGGAWLGLRHRGAKAGPRPDRNLVAVFPFRVTGADPNLAYLHEGMVELLAVKLTGDGGPRSVDPSAILGAWRSRVKAGTDPDRQTALSIAGTLGAARVIDGSVVGSPAHLTLTASLLGQSHEATPVSVEGPLDSLSILVDRLTAGMLAGESGAADHSGELTTTSLPALRAYLNGQAAYRRGSYKEAVEHFDRALQIDSSFALAALSMANAAGWCCTDEAKDRAIRVAWAGRQRLSTRDQALLQATAGPRYPNPSPTDEAVRMWEKAVAAAPDRPEAWYGMGDLLFHLGDVLALSSSWERSAEAFRRALQFDSTFAGPLEHLLEYAARVGDTTTARHLLQVARSTDSTGEIFPYLRWRTAVATGDSAELQRVRAQFPAMKEQSLTSIMYISQYDGLSMKDVDAAVRIMRARASTGRERAAALYHVWSTAMNAGRPKEGSAALREYREVEATPHTSLYWHILDGIFWGGDTVAAVSAANELEGLAKAPARGDRGRDLQLKDRCILEHWRLYRGQTATVSQTITALRAPQKAHDFNSALNISVNNSCVVMLEAWQAVLLRRPDAKHALMVFDSLELSGTPGLLADYQYGNLLLARLFEATGDLPRALAAVRRRHYFLGPPLYLTTFLREEGRLAEALGDRAGAMRAYDHYLALRADHESSVDPEVRDVKTEFVKLLGEKPVD